MRVLLVSNNVDPSFSGPSDLEQALARVEGIRLEVLSGPSLARSPARPDFDRLVVSGSPASCVPERARADGHDPWIARLEQLIRDAVSAGKPVLGVCFGHQVLARALGGAESVRSSATPEFGWSRIELLERAPLLEGLPVSFDTCSAHFDEVHRLPPGARLLARSERCAIQGFALEERPVYGIQFHPEKDVAAALKAVEYCRKQGRLEALLREGEGPSLYDSRVGATIFSNFVQRL